MRRDHGSHFISVVIVNPLEIIVVDEKKIL